MTIHRVILALSAAACTTCFCADSVSAFNSYFPSVHSEITKAGAERAGWSNSSRKYCCGFFCLFTCYDTNTKHRDRLADRVQKVDWDESSTKFGCAFWKYFPNGSYFHAHHFDRPPGTTNAVAFADGRDYVYNCFLNAKAAGNAGNYGSGNYGDMIYWAGNLCHAIEDVFSHSNYVDLSCSNKTLFVNYIKAIHSGPPYPNPPSTAYLTAYCGQNNSSVPCTGLAKCDSRGSLSPDSEFPHDRWCKDNDKTLQGSLDVPSSLLCGSGATTKFKMAKGAATDMVAYYLSLLPVPPPPAPSSASTSTIASGRVVPGPDDSVADPIPADSSYLWVCRQVCDSTQCRLACSADASLQFQSRTFAGDEIVTLRGVPANFGGFDPEALAISDLQETVAWVEIVAENPDAEEADTVFSQPASLTFTVPDSAFVDLNTKSLAVYYFDPGAGEWGPVAGASVSPQPGGVHAAFAQIQRPGVYAVGGVILGQAAPMASRPGYGVILMVLMGLGSVWIWRWGHRRPASA